MYEGNPQAIAEGRRLFNWYNCSGCHSNGGGGFGPALMDQHWRYGGNLDQIFNYDFQGRPNGMPSWHGKIPNAQIWELAAFVKSLSAPSAANAGQQPKPMPPAPPAVQPTPPPPARRPRPNELFRASGQRLPGRGRNRAGRAPPCASAPTRTTCRSPTAPAMASRTGSWR